MLDQRRAKENGYITLREAGDLCNYAPDYIGQLIRKGKIRGEQVYSNVAWVTTEEEIRAYMADKSRTVADVGAIEKRAVFRERALSYALYAVIGILFLLLLCMQYIFYVSIDDKMNEKLFAQTTAEENS